MKELMSSNKQFRFFAIYQLFSGIGNGMFGFFMLLGVHLLYRNPVYTGISAFLFGLPFIVAFIAGPLVDASNKVKIMRITSFVEFVALAVLVAFTVFGEIPVLVMFAVILGFSVAALFEGVSGNAFLRQIVDEDKLLEANSAINVISLVGGLGVAAAMFRMVAEDRLDFTIIFGLSMVFVALAFLLSFFLRDTGIRSTLKGDGDGNGDEKSHSYFANLKEGAAFLKHSVLLFFLMGTTVRMFIMEAAYVNMPAFVEHHWGARGYILLAVMSMIGGLFASIIVGRFGKHLRVGQFLFMLLLLAGAVRIVFAYLLPESLTGSQGLHILYATIGSSMGIVSGTMAQKLSPKDMVARVGTLSTTITAISTAIGALFGGWLGGIVADTGNIFVIQGAVYIVVSICLILVPRVRHLPKMNELEEVTNEST